MHTHDARLTVRYAETDQMGVVYYANYLVWMEVGRVGYCKSVGFNYRDMELNDAVGLAVVEANCRYQFPARYDDEVVVRTWIEHASSRGVRFGYEMKLAASGRILATGYTKHLFCGRDMRPVRLPEKYRSVFGLSS